jgi:hypothetical protein
MPKIHEEQIVIKLYKLIKNDQETVSIVNQELIDSLHSVVEELAEPGIIVEVEELQ